MKRSAVATCATLALTLLPACGAESGSADDLEQLPGVRAAAVHRQAIDTGAYSYTAVVDMEADASSDELVGALDGLAEWFADGHGGEDGVRLYVGAGSVEVYGGWGDEGDGSPTAVVTDAGSHQQNVAHADLLLRATDVLGLPVTVRGYGWQVRTDEPRATLQKVAADPALARMPGVHLFAPFPTVGDQEGTVPDGWARPAEFGSSEPVRRQHVATYDAAVATARLLGEGQARVDFVGSDPGVDPRPTDTHPGAIEIRMYLRLPGMAGPRALAEDPLDDPRWPVVAAQLDLLRNLPEGSRVSVGLESGTAPEGGPGNLSWLVDVGVGETQPGRPRGAWQQAAFAHLNR